MIIKRKHRRTNHCVISMIAGVWVLPKQIKMQMLKRFREIRDHILSKLVNLDVVLCLASVSTWMIELLSPNTLKFNVSWYHNIGFLRRNRMQETFGKGKFISLHSGIHLPFLPKNEMDSVSVGLNYIWTIHYHRVSKCLKTIWSPANGNRIRKKWFSAVKVDGHRSVR